MEAKGGLNAALVEAAQFPIFKGLKMSDLETLCQQGQIVLSSHREVLFRYGDQAQYFGFVLNGAYKLSRPAPSGDEIIMHFLTPGDFIAAFIMAQSHPTYPITATSMGASRFLRIPREIFLTKWKHYPDLLFKIQGVLSLRMGQLHSQKALQKAPLSVKVAALLIELMQRQPQQESEIVVPLPLTRKEIADNLGASVESVIRIMSDWSKRGIIETSEKNIKIVKPEFVISEMNQDQD